MTLHRETRGTALVEFAIVMPILFLLLVGILELGRAYNAYSTVRAASAEGVHWAALHPGASMDDITAAVHKRVVPLDARKVEVTAYYDLGSGFDEWGADGIAPATPARIVPIRVEVRYPLDSAIVTFFVASFIPDIHDTKFTAAATAEALR